MGKKYFAVIVGVVAGVICALFGFDTYAATGNAVTISGGEWDICVATTGDYNGSSFVADIASADFASQLVYDDFADESCKTIELPAGSDYVVTMNKPMGVGEMSYAAVNNKLIFTVDNASGKYLKSYGQTTQRIAASRVEISFNANGGEGLMATIPNVALNTNITLPANTMTRAGYKFNGWNTKVDGTGTSYAEGDTISFATGGEVALYAQWTVSYAVLDEGSNVNSRMKRIVADTSYFGATDRSIRAIKTASVLPAGFDENDSRYIISASNSPMKIYAWFDDTDNDNDGDGDGVIYIYSAADEIRAGANMYCMFYNMASLTDISALSGWNTSYVTSVNGLFLYASSLTDISALSSWDTSSVTDMSGMFSGAGLTDISALSSWDTSSVTKMHLMFQSTKITNTDALETKQHAGNDYVSWDVSKVTDMSGMFSGAELTDISALSSWDTSSVTDMSGMFSGAELTDISALSSWDTSSATNMRSMFSDTKITNTDALETKQYAGNDYVSWDVSKVTDMSSMFVGIEFTDISALSSWDTSSVTNMRSMFRGAKIANTDALETKQYAGNDYVSWDVSKVTNMSSMFERASDLIDVSALSGWDTSSVTNMNKMFYQTKITNTDALETKQYVGNDYVSWDVSKVTDMGYMFYKVSSFADISALSSWDTSSVTNMEYMFFSTKITNTDALETKQHAGNDYVSWDVSKVTNMNSVFEGASKLADISALSGWNTSNVVNMERMFFSTKIANIDALETKQHAGNDYVSWDVSKVTDMSSMFSGAKFADISALSSWNTSSVTKMRFMFQSTKITNTDALETKQHAGNDYVSWDVSKVTDMGCMFCSTAELTDISALSGWNTSSVTNTSSMFSGTKITNTDALETKQHAGNDYVSWDVSKVTNMSSMFYEATSLTDISALSSWNTSSVLYMWRMFKGVTGVADFSVLDGWTLNASLSKTDMFSYVSPTAILPWWY